MAKMTFNKDRNKKEFKSIDETLISKPNKTFDSNSLKKMPQSSNKKMGRPSKGKTYSTIRIQKNTVNQINSIQNVLGFETQDDLILSMLDRLKNTLDNDQLTMYQMYMKTYETKWRINKKYPPPKLIDDGYFFRGYKRLRLSIGRKINVHVFEHLQCSSLFSRNQPFFTFSYYLYHIFSLLFKHSQVAIDN